MGPLEFTKIWSLFENRFWCLGALLGIFSGGKKPSDHCPAVFPSARSGGGRTYIHKTPDRPPWAAVTRNIMHVRCIRDHLHWDRWCARAICPFTGTEGSRKPPVLLRGPVCLLKTSLEEPAPAYNTLHNYSLAVWGIIILCIMSSLTHF